MSDIEYDKYEVKSCPKCNSQLAIDPNKKVYWCIVCKYEEKINGK